MSSTASTRIEFPGFRGAQLVADDTSATSVEAKA